MSRSAPVPGQLRLRGYSHVSVRERVVGNRVGPHDGVVMAASFGFASGRTAPLKIPQGQAWSSRRRGDRRQQYLSTAAVGGTRALRRARSTTRSHRVGVSVGRRVLLCARWGSPAAPSSRRRGRAGGRGGTPASARGPWRRQSGIQVRSKPASIAGSPALHRDWLKSTRPNRAAGAGVRARAASPNWRSSSQDVDTGSLKGQAARAAADFLPRRCSSRVSRLPRRSSRDRSRSRARIQPSASCRATTSSSKPTC